MKNYDHLIWELRGRLPEYVSQKGLRLGVPGKRRNIRCLNPQHEDRHPSMSYDDRSRRLHCFSCGESYDLFDLIGMDYPDCDSFPRKVKRACELFDLPFPADFGREESPQAARPLAKAGVRAAQRQAKKKAAPPPEAPSEDYTEKVARELQKNGAGGNYFSARGLSKALCERFGLYEENGRAIIPIYCGGRCLSYCGRATGEQTQPRYKNSPGQMGLFGADYLMGEGEGGALFITEAALDALSAEELGFRAVGLCGVGNVQKFLKLCAENPAAANAYELIAAGDADEAGSRMNEAVQKGLAELGLRCRVFSFPEGIKDFNEYLLKDREGLREALGQAAYADRYAYARTSAAHAVGALLDLSIRRGSRSGIATGFASLDRALDGGFYAGLYIIGAVSSLGKTTFVLQIADYVAESGSDVLYFSLEMSRMELMAKSISRISWRLDPSAERADAFTARQVLRFDQEMPASKGVLLSRSIERYQAMASNLFIREGVADIGALEIRDAVREHIRLRGKKPLVVLDYLQILKPSDTRASDKQNTDRAVVELKRISRDFDLPVFAISSFNRDNYRNAVSMEAFKESGAVEYSSDVLFGLQFEGAGCAGFDLNEAKARAPRRIELVMLKNRNGVPYVKIPYTYSARFNYFIEG